MDYMFNTRPYWKELSVPESVVSDKYKEYFGSDIIEFFTREEAVNYLLKITKKIQEKMVSQLQGDKAYCLLKDLYKILDEAFNVEMYIYGLASQALSLVSLSDKFALKELFTGIGRSRRTLRGALLR